MMMGIDALGRAAFGSSETGHPNMHYRSKLTLVVFISSLSLMGCSGEEDSTQQQKDHVFKNQTQTIDKARNVARQLDEAAGKQKEAAQ